MPPDNACPNCGSEVLARYCANCGQSQSRADASLFQILSEAFGELTDLDSRIWLTVRTLLFRPGRITRDYCQYRRARYLPPFRIYILTNVLLYFVINWFDGGVRVGLGIDVPALEDGGFRFFDPNEADIVPQVGFIMLPFLALGLTLLYLNQRKSYSDHFVAALHIKTLVAILIAIAAIINGLWTTLEYLFGLDLRNIGGRITLLLMPIIIVYLIASLQTIYGGKLLLNIIRVPVLLVAYFYTAAGIVYLVGFLLIHLRIG